MRQGGEEKERKSIAKKKLSRATNKPNTQIHKWKAKEMCVCVCVCAPAPTYVRVKIEEKKELSNGRFIWLVSRSAFLLYVSHLRYEHLQPVQCVYLLFIFVVAQSSVATFCNTGVRCFFSPPIFFHINSGYIAGEQLPLWKIPYSPSIGYFRTF